MAISSAPGPQQENQEFFSNNSFILVIILVGTFLFGVSFIIFKACYTKHESLRRSSRDTTPEDIIYSQRPTVDHLIWHIITVGLPQSVIDSIPVFKYKKGEALMEGTECSVCLSEFQDEETLRLLPKCSHAFHMHCIDTWLRSHQNCPLCRAPIINSSLVADADISVPATPTFTTADAHTINIDSQAESGEQTTEGLTRMGSFTLEVSIVDGSKRDSARWCSTHTVEISRDVSGSQ